MKRKIRRAGAIDDKQICFLPFLNRKYFFFFTSLLLTRSEQPTLLMTYPSFDFQSYLLEYLFICQCVLFLIIALSLTLTAIHVIEFLMPTRACYWTAFNSVFARQTLLLAWGQCHCLSHMPTRVISPYRERKRLEIETIRLCKLFCTSRCLQLLKRGFGVSRFRGKFDDITNI